jgi:hypothetical protein
MSKKAMLPRAAPSKSDVFDVARARTTNIASPTPLAIDPLLPGSPPRVRRGSRGFQNHNRALPHHTPAKRREILGPGLVETLGLWRTGSAQTARRLLGQTRGRWWVACPKKQCCLVPPQQRRRLQRSPNGPIRGGQGLDDLSSVRGEHQIRLQESSCPHQT